MPINGATTAVPNCCMLSNWSCNLIQLSWVTTIYSVPNFAVPFLSPTPYPSTTAFSKCEWNRSASPPLATTLAFHYESGACQWKSVPQSVLAVSWAHSSLHCDFCSRTVPQICVARQELSFHQLSRHYLSPPFTTIKPGIRDSLVRHNWPYQDSQVDILCLAFVVSF